MRRDSAQTATRTGRRSGPSGTRDAILAAARTHFASEGYSASLRTIAGTAGVDVALIRHFFGSKDALFDAILEIPEDTDATILEALAGDSDQLGERLVRAYLSLWEDPKIAEPLLAIARTALATQRTAEHLRTRLAERLLNGGLTGLVPGQRVRLVALVGPQLMGIALARYIVRSQPLVDMDIEEIAALVGPGIQQLLMAPPNRELTARDDGGAAVRQVAEGMVDGT